MSTVVQYNYWVLKTDGAASSKSEMNMNIYGCSVLRHLNGNVRCAASAAHENNVNGNVDGRPHDHTQLTAHPEQTNRAPYSRTTGRQDHHVPR